MDRTFLLYLHAMTVLKQGDPPEKARTRLEDLRAEVPRMETKKHCGVLKLEHDPVDYQKRLRDDWNERAR